MRALFSLSSVSRLLALGVMAMAGAQAQAALPTSGTCGFVLNQPHPALNWTVGNYKKVVVSDILGSINFSTNTISYNATTLTYDGSAWQYGSVNGSQTFSVGSALSNPSGTYPISFTLSGTTSVSGGNVSLSTTLSVTTTLNLLPTNSGNTVLIQGANEKMTGVCQMM